MAPPTVHMVLMFLSKSSDLYIRTEADGAEINSLAVQCERSS